MADNRPGIMIMAILGKALLGAVIGIFSLALLAGILVSLFSGNTHDRAQEIPLSAFMFGVGGAVRGLIVGLIIGLTRSG